MSEPNLSDRSVLVTGGAGFVGGQLVQTLAPDNDVTVLDDLSTGERDRVPDDVTFVHGDVRDQRKLKQEIEAADVVFHEAAVVGVPASLRDPPRSNHVNTGATVQLLDYARQYDTRVVLASSAAIYGEPESVPIGEDHPLEPTSPYGVDKLAVDHYARVFAQQYDLPVVPLRYFNIYGPRTGPNPYSAVVDVFLEQARNGEPITVHGTGEQTRDFVHVDDVVQSNLRAATTDEVGVAYNVGTGSSVSIAELAELIRSATDSDSPITHTDERPGDISDSEADISRARERLGYEPTVDLRSGIDRLVDAATPADPPSSS
ncbi:NAD-dependent epimerase/dehydratase family protein [Halomicrobium sp. HM KBTZ05]|uniref:NAD-dependent epimerase/dehydratase family protein n=1 Tax=Halomicrobium sp. HM KBTZ05 TaxID=3242663 RepID=UPI003556BFF5